MAVRGIGLGFNDLFYLLGTNIIRFILDFNHQEMKLKSSVLLLKLIF